MQSLEELGLQYLDYKDQNLLMPNDIELQPMPVKTTSKQTQDLLVEDTIQPIKVTPLILKKKLEDDLGIDFSA